MVVDHGCTMKDPHAVTHDDEHTFDELVHDTESANPLCDGDPHGTFIDEETGLCAMCGGDVIETLTPDSDAPAPELDDIIDRNAEVSSLESSPSWTGWNRSYHRDAIPPPSGMPDFEFEDILGDSKPWKMPEFRIEVKSDTRAPHDVEDYPDGTKRIRVCVPGLRAGEIAVIIEDDRIFVKSMVVPEFFDPIGRSWTIARLIGTEVTATLQRGVLNISAPVAPKQTIDLKVVEVKDD